MHVATLRRAASLVAWSNRTADDLVEGYGIPRDRIEVIPPGVSISRWRRPDDRPVGPIVRVLHVTDDPGATGAGLVIEAVARANRHLDRAGHDERLELHLATTGAFDFPDSVRVHRSLDPDALVALHHACDVFAFPAAGDCSPLVLTAAAASGLAVVATPVGAVPERIDDGHRGRLVAPLVPALTDALVELARDATERRRLGANAAAHAARGFDADVNAERILDRLLAHAERRAQPRVALTVSGEVDPSIRTQIAERARPLADYVAIADATGARLIDRAAVRADLSPVTALVRRLAGPDLAMAYHLFRQRRTLDVVVTDGEQIGLPLAALLRVGRRRGPRHVMIGHRLTHRGKVSLIRRLGLARRIDEVLVYSTSQRLAAEELFGHAETRVRLIDFMVDSEFFTPAPTGAAADTDRPLLSSAGRELRDYPTLIESVRDLDVDLVIASASPWSKRADNALVAELPPNVTVTSLSQAELRDLYARSTAVVVPLLPTDFQAGVTTILEAMAMGLPVICTRTIGQIDVVEEGVSGYYVPPGDVSAMSRAIEALVAEPEVAAAMGRRGREFVKAHADVRLYAETVAEFVGHRSADRDTLPADPGDEWA